MSEDRAADLEPEKLEETSAPPPELCKRSKATGSNSKEEELPVSEAALLTDEILHGVPLTIYKCKFQAHIARIDSVEEARAVFRAVSSQIAHEARSSEYVCPFAFRLSCDGAQKNPRRLEEPSTEKQAYGSTGDESIMGDGTQEGFCDNGDVGSGEKLLYLLQNWDVRHGVVVVSRINGGFMMAELLGIRRYKFVLDRAKRMLENSGLAPFRQALGTDPNPATAGDSCIDLPLREALANGWHDPAHRTPDHRTVAQDNSDLQALPGSVRKFASSGKSRDERPIGRHVAGEGATPQRNALQGGRTRDASQPKNMVARATGLSTRTRERQPLSLAQLRISSDTVAFPQRHMPSIMGDKGYGVKRGRINHFEFPTPPSTPGCDSAVAAVEEAIIHPNEIDHVDVSEDSDPGGALRRIARPSGWSLPGGHAPFASTTSPRKGGQKVFARGEITGAEGIQDSPQSTLEGGQDQSEDDGRNSLETKSSSMTGRLSMVIAGVGCRISKDHPLYPPPPSTKEVGQHRREDGSKTGLGHYRPLSSASVTVDESDEGLSCEIFPEATSDASSSGHGGGESRHLAPPSASLGIAGVSQAGESSMSQGSDSDYDGDRGSPGQMLPIFQAIRGKSLSRREDDSELPIPGLRCGSNANGLSLPTIGKT